MTTDEKQQIVGLLEEIVGEMCIWADIPNSRKVLIINGALDKHPIISGRMGDDLKVREEG